MAPATIRPPSGPLTLDTQCCVGTLCTGQKGCVGAVYTPNACHMLGTCRVAAWMRHVRAVYARALCPMYAPCALHASAQCMILLLQIGCCLPLPSALHNHTILGQGLVYRSLVWLCAVALFSLCLYAGTMPKKISLWFNCVADASWAPIVRHLEGAMKDLIPNPQMFVPTRAPPLRAKWASMLWSTLSGLNNEFDLQKMSPTEFVRRASGWVQSRTGGSHPEYPPPLL